MAFSLPENCQQDRCIGNALLRGGDSLLSRKFILQENGNLEILCDGNKIWESHTKGKSIDGLYIAKGGLVLYAPDRTVVWQKGSWKRDTNPETVIMQNDGNFVMYDKNGNAIWELGTKGKCPKGI